MKAIFILVFGGMAMTPFDGAGHGGIPAPAVQALKLHGGIQ